MTVGALHLAVEILGLVGFLLCWANAWARYGRLGFSFFTGALVAAFVRENWVAWSEVLYGFAPLTIQFGVAPAIASTVWGTSLWFAVVWAEAMTGEPLTAPRLSLRFWLGISTMMLALAALYEPFLATLALAKWEEGTLRWLEVPVIAFVGYPTFGLGYLALWRWSIRAAPPATGRIGQPPGGWRRARRYLLALVVLALAHAHLLRVLKRTLGW